MTRKDSHWSKRYWWLGRWLNDWLMTLAVRRHPEFARQADEYKMLLAESLDAIDRGEFVRFDSGREAAEWLRADIEEFWVSDINLDEPWLSNG